ncbi:MAG TPA: alpha/beta hydrolase [Steroidobacteraceae bacterium]|nr:alpha/beta hydrolase [Steroidobacteraceae bacterium]
MRARLAALGTELTPTLLQGTTKLLASIAAPRDEGVSVTRDHQYGPDARNRLDIHRKGHPDAAPVLVYVHGGGFVMGDKTSAGSPFYDNIGQWAAQQGYIGVTLTYRLAPVHHWPSGPQDMALAVRWLRQHIGAHGGDPEKIFLLGQSAGAVHVAAYTAHSQFHAEGGAGIAGALMTSGIYDPTTQPPSQFNVAYYGDSPATLAEARCTAGLLATKVPLLFSVSEMDPKDFQDQAAQIAAAWHAAKGIYPPMEYLAGHNHLSPAQCIGSAEDDLGPRVARFIANACAPPVTAA